MYVITNVLPVTSLTQRNLHKEIIIQAVSSAETRQRKKITVLSK